MKEELNQTSLFAEAGRGPWLEKRGGDILAACVECCILTRNHGSSARNSSRQAAAYQTGRKNKKQRKRTPGNMKRRSMRLTTERWLFPPSSSNLKNRGLVKAKKLLDVGKNSRDMSMYLPALKRPRADETKNKVMFLFNLTKTGSTHCLARVTHRERNRVAEKSHLYTFIHSHTHVHMYTHMHTQLHSQATACVIHKRLCTWKYYESLQDFKNQPYLNLLMFEKHVHRSADVWWFAHTLINTIDCSSVNKICLQI